MSASGRVWRGFLQSELVMPASQARRSVVFERHSRRGTSGPVATATALESARHWCDSRATCQPSPSFRFKVPMSGSNAVRPLTLFWE